MEEALAARAGRPFGTPARKQALDAAAYFMGHGLQNVRCLRGGIDAWAQEIDPKLRRYKIG